MVDKEVIYVCSDEQKQHVNAVCGQKVGFLNVKPVVFAVLTGLVRAKSCSSLYHKFIHFQCILQPKFQQILLDLTNNWQVVITCVCTGCPMLEGKHLTS